MNLYISYFHAQHLSPTASWPHTNTDYSSHGRQYWCGRHGRHACKPISQAGSIAQQRHQHHHRRRHHLHQRPPLSSSTTTSNTTQAQPRNSHQLTPQQCLGQRWEGIRRRRSKKEKRQVHGGRRPRDSSQGAATSRAGKKSSGASGLLSHLTECYPRVQGGDRRQPSIDTYQEEACPPVPSSSFLLPSRSVVKKLRLRFTVRPRHEKLYLPCRK